LPQCAEAKLRIRYLIVLNLVRGRTPIEVATLLGVSRSTVYNVARRFRECGEA
jgi:transposase